MDNISVLFLHISWISFFLFAIISQVDLTKSAISYSQCNKENFPVGHAIGALETDIPIVSKVTAPWFVANFLSSLCLHPGCRFKKQSRYWIPVRKRKTTLKKCKHAILTGLPSVLCNLCKSPCTFNVYTHLQHRDFSVLKNIKSDDNLLLANF